MDKKDKDIVKCCVPDKDKAFVVYYVDCSDLRPDKAMILCSEVKKHIEKAFDDSIVKVVVPCRNGLKHNKVEVFNVKKMTKVQYEEFIKFVQEVKEFKYKEE